MRDSLLALGGTSKVHPFGTTAFRMTTQDAKPPFRDISVVVTLLPREMPFNWAIGIAQGRRDTAVVEASLRRSPRAGFELVDPGSRVGRRRKRAVSTWSAITVAGLERLLRAKDERTAKALLEALEPSALAAISALHVTAGSEPGIAASLALEQGNVSMLMSAIQGLAERMAV